MSIDITRALERTARELQQHPEHAVEDDSTATATWQQGLRIVAAHANGTQVATDMPAALGGSGDRVTPGWLFRAGLASCTATSIAIRAAAEGIALDALEVRVTSRTDARGILALRNADGAPVPAGPCELKMQVRIASAGVPAARLRALVEDGCRCSPIQSAVQEGLPPVVEVQIG
jgi:uncharacterized OsmC-like protein